MKAVNAKRVVSYQTDDNLFRVTVCRQIYDGIEAHEVEAEFNGVSVGSIFIDREEDLTMLAEALSDYVETRNLCRKEVQQ